MELVQVFELGIYSMDTEHFCIRLLFIALGVTALESKCLNEKWDCIDYEREERTIYRCGPFMVFMSSKLGWLLITLFWENLLLGTSITLVQLQFTLEIAFLSICLYILKRKLNRFWHKKFNCFCWLLHSRFSSCLLLWDWTYYPYISPNIWNLLK